MQSGGEETKKGQGQKGKGDGWKLDPEKICRLVVRVGVGAGAGVVAGLVGTAGGSVVLACAAAGGAGGLLYHWAREQFEVSRPPPASSETNEPKALVNGGNGIKPETAGLVGLTKIHRMSCFMSSGLQCLLRTPSLKKYFLEDRHLQDINMTHERSKRGLVAKSFGKLMKLFWSGDHSVITALDFGQVIKSIDKFWFGGARDVQQFVEFVLSSLHDDLNRVAAMPQPEEEGEGEVEEEESEGEVEEEVEVELKVLSPLTQARLRIQEDRLRDDSFIRDEFYGLRRTEISTRCCGPISSFHVFSFLSLRIPKKSGRLTLDDCFRDYFRKQRLECKCTNAHCKKGSVSAMPATMQVGIWKPSEVLVIYLQRCVGMTARKGMVKNDTLVEYPHVLDLFEYISAPQESARSMFDLYAVSAHVAGDHFVTYARSEDKEEWFKLDDKHASRMKKKEVVNKAGYLLFYERRKARTG